MTQSDDIITTPITMGDLQRLCKYIRKGYCLTGANRGGACMQNRCPILQRREVKSYAKNPKTIKGI